MWKTASYFRVAAYWPTEGYGGISSFDTLPEAMAYRETMLGKGYRNVHVWEVRIATVPETMTEHLPEYLERLGDAPAKRKRGNP